MSDLAKVAAEHSYHPLVKACRCTMGRVAPVHLEREAWAEHLAQAYQEARTIRTVEALQALPDGSVIREEKHGDVLVRSGQRWGSGTDEHGWTPGSVLLPALLLWTPGDET